MPARRNPLLLAAAVAALLGSTFASAAQAQTAVNFDDLGPSNGGGASLPNPYQGFNWTLGNNSFGWISPASPFTDDVCRSGTNCAYNGFGKAVAVSGATPFTFNGYIRRWNLSNNTGGTGSVLVQAMSGATVLGSQTLSLNSTYQFFEVLTAGMTSLRFSPQGGDGYFLMDDITFNPTVNQNPGSNQSVVPEPSTYLLMAVGLGALAVASKRRRRVV